MADIDLIARNPMIGDKVRNRRAADHQTRTVVDRNLRGDVFYKFVDRPGMRYESWCTHESWKRFCDGAKVYALSPSHHRKSPAAGHSEPKP